AGDPSDNYLLSRTSYDWQSVQSGQRMQIFVREQMVEEYPLFAPPSSNYASQCTVHRNSIYSGGSPDLKTRVITSCSMPCGPEAGTASDLCTPDVTDKKQIEMTYVVPTGDHSVWDRPSRIVSRYVNSAEQVVKTSEKEFYYDGLALGAATRGRLTQEKTKLS